MRILNQAVELVISLLEKVLVFVGNVFGVGELQSDVEISSTNPLVDNGAMTSSLDMSQKRKENTESNEKEGILTENSQAPADVTPSVLEKYGNRHILIFYGSQTGNSEIYSKYLCKFLKSWCLDCLTIDPLSFHYEDFEKLSDSGNILCIFILSTYGNGEPTDNAIPLNDFLCKKQTLPGLHYCVFAVGDRNYESFCTFGRFVDQAMYDAGAVRLAPRVDADINVGFEHAFMEWRESLVPLICKSLEVPKRKFSSMELQDYRMVTLGDIDMTKVFVGEIFKLGSYSRQKRPFHQKNPFLSPLLVNKEIFNSTERSCKLIEFDLSNSSLRYDPGDHVGVYPTNNPQLVSWLGQLINADLEQVINMEQVDKEDSIKRYPFPCPTTIRTAFMYYLDITSPVPIDILKELLSFTSSPQDVMFLERLTDITDNKLYQEWIIDARRNIVCVLEDLPTTVPPVSLLLEMLPRLSCRYYSIASSPKLHPKSVQIAAVIVDWIATSGRKKQGVATTYLKKKRPKTDSDSSSSPDRVPIFIRRAAQFHMPKKNNVPVIMIGCGSGVAPFKGFIEDRFALTKEDYNGKIGEMLLFYGCRNMEKDFLFKEEFEKYKDEGILTHMFVATSRDQDRKFYITEQIRLQASLVWLYLERGAYLYICGPSKINLNVQSAIHHTIHQAGNMEEEKVVNYIKNLKSKGRYCVDLW